MKTLTDFDWSFNAKIPKAKIVELASARFVATQAGVLLIGPPGVGKSHIATAIAVGAIRAGRRALVRSTFDLAADFAEADATGERRDLVQQLTRVDLLVLEDFGMKKLGSSNAAEDILEFFVRRHENGVDAHHDESADAGFGHLSWRCCSAATGGPRWPVRRRSGDASPRGRAQMFAQELAGLRGEQADVQIIPLHVDALADPAGGAP